MSWRAVALWATMSSSLVAQSPEPPDSPAGRALRQFITAYNSGSFDTLTQFIAAHPDFRTSGPSRFVEVWREYGPVILAAVEPRDSLHLAAWTRGTISRAPLGFIIQMQATRPSAIDSKVSRCTTC